MASTMKLTHRNLTVIDLNRTIKEISIAVAQTKDGELICLNPDGRLSREKAPAILEKPKP
jgi:hypothetical protein